MSWSWRRVNLKEVVSVGPKARTRWEGFGLLKRLASVTLTVFCCLCLMLATERRAMAYIDPGSGLLALQSLGSMLAAAGFFLRRRIMRLFHKEQPLGGLDSPKVAEKEDSRNAA